MEVLWNESRPGIYIEDSHGSSFKFQTMRALDKINSKPIGADLLKILSQRHQGVGIRKKGLKVVIALGQGTLIGNSSLSLTYQSSTGAGGEIRQPAKPGSVIRLPGSGMGSVVQYNPNIEHQYNAIGVMTPAFVALAHELIHAMHAISGDVTKAYSWKNATSGSSNGAILEEARTVGLGKYANSRITENAIRHEHHLTQRTYYSAPGDCSHLRA